MVRGTPPSGIQMFILKDTVLTSAGWGREKGWDERCHDPCHPLSGPMSMRMPMRMFPRRRAGSGAPPCNPPCLWPPVLIQGTCDQCHSFSVQESSVEGRLLQPHATLPSLELSQPRSELRLCLGWGSAVVLRSPTQFNSEGHAEGDSQSSTSHPASHFLPELWKWPLFL